ncbi:MFS transporter [Tepidibacter mesophilus]|uniref:MFS transporter n=1 Tax=Tepidibacter mesophilus TaxID=655607 RepID=UPI00241FE501|nr:MFS transporter [Tepidibacter mesophilus]
MLIIGFCESMKGVFVSQFKQIFEISDSSIGFMFSISVFGYIISTYAGGILCSRFGQKKILIFSTMIIGVSYLIMSIAPTFTILLISVFITNIGTGLQAISVNSISPILFVTYGTILINLTHFFYGFGVSISQKFSGYMILKNYTFRDIFFINSGLMLVSILFIIFIKFPRVEPITIQLNIYKTLKNKLVLLFIFAQGLYVFSEIGFLNWFVNFAQTSYDFTIDKATHYSAIFFLVFTLGRLTGGFVVHRLGIKRSMITYLSMSLILFWSGYLFKSNFIILISLSGFFFSIIFPTTITMIGETFKENTSYIMGLILSFVSIINMLMNSLMGILSSSLSPYIAFSLIPIALSLSLLFYANIFKKIETL